MAIKSSATKALVVAQELTSDELTALLQQSGWAEKPRASSVPRLKMEGPMLTTEEGEMFVYNPAKPTIPACTVRIVKPPEDYYAFWISDGVAKQFGRAELGGMFSKSYVNYDANREITQWDEVYEALKNRDDIVDDYGKPLKPSWKGDIYVQIVPEDGVLNGDETIYVLTLSTTSMIEWKGASWSKTPTTGAVASQNFIQKLCHKAIDAATEAKQDPKAAVMAALNSLALGGVVAEVRLLRAENKERGQNWTVVSFDPIHIEPVQDNAVIAAGETNNDEDPAF